MFINDDWLSDPAFRSWMSKTKNAQEARCFLCKTNFDIPLMGVSALRSHAKGKHQATASSSKVRSVDSRHFASNKENSDDCGEPVHSTASATAKTTSTIVDLRSVDAEIRRCLRMVNCHNSYNSCADLGAMFHFMFPDSEIASQFTLGKTKARYTQCFMELPLNSRSS